jgi:hypothetical protein
MDGSPAYIGRCDLDKPDALQLSNRGTKTVAGTKI